MSEAVVGDVRYLLDAGFFNGQWIGEGDPPDWSFDRMYDSEEMNEPYRQVVTEGIFCPEQVVDNEAELVPGFNCQASGANQVVLYRGSGIIGGKWFRMDGEQAIAVPDNNLNTSRIDAVIIELDNEDRAIYLVYRKGTGPNEVALVNNATYQEFRLFNLSVTSANVSTQSITPQDTRGTEECPYITGLLQQLTLDERLNKFDQDVQDKLDSFDADFDNKMAAYDNAFNDKIESYDDQLASKLAVYDGMMDDIQQEWNQLKQQIIDTGGTGSNTEITFYRQTLTYTSGMITVEPYSVLTDNVFVFINGFYANTVNDYTFEDGVITFKNTINSGAVIDIINMRVMSSPVPVDGFSITLLDRDDIAVAKDTSDDTYPVITGETYTAYTPDYQDATWKWQYRSEAGGAWTDIPGANTRTISLVPSTYHSIQCIVTYDGEDKTSAEVVFSEDDRGVVATPVFNAIYLSEVVPQIALDSDGLGFACSNWSSITDVTNKRLVVKAPVAGGTVNSTDGTISFTVGSAESSSGNALVMAQNTAYNTSTMRFSFYIENVDNPSDRSQETVVYVLTDASRAYTKIPAPTLSASRSGSTITISISGKIPNVTYYYGTSSTQSSQTTQITTTATMNSNSAYTFYAHGEASNIQSSDNSNAASVGAGIVYPTSWIKSTSASTVGNGQDGTGAGIRFYNGKFFIFLYGDPYLMYSSDGITWHECNLPYSTMREIDDVYSYTNGYYAVGYVSNSERVILHSSDGITFTEIFSSSDMVLNEICGTDNTDLVSIGSTFPQARYSTDSGESWVAYDTNLPVERVDTDGHGHIFGTGHSTSTCYFITLSDVSTWTELSKPSDAASYRRSLDAHYAYVDSKHMFVYNTNAADIEFKIAVYSSISGSPSVFSLPSDISVVYGIAASNDNVVMIPYMGGSSNSEKGIYYALWNGSSFGSWNKITTITQGAANAGRRIAYGNGRAVYIGFDADNVYYSNLLN